MRRTWPPRAARQPPRQWARARRSSSAWSRPRCRSSCSRNGSRSGPNTTRSRAHCMPDCAAHRRAPSCWSSPCPTQAGKVANIVFAVIADRRGRNVLSVRDQNTFDGALRQKRLMTLNHLFLVHRYKIWAVHYADGVKALLSPDRDRLNALIRREYPYVPVEVAAQIPQMTARGRRCEPPAARSRTAHRRASAVVQLRAEHWGSDPGPWAQGPSAVSWPHGTGHGGVWRTR
jgi:hypothetical protein